MKKQNGITLSSLVIYIIVMIMVVGVMSSVSFMFYRNNQQLTGDTTDMLEYNNFNQYFINEIKSAQNKVDQISQDGSYITFTSGNSFSFRNNAIYFNEIQISKNVKSASFQYYSDDNGKREDVISVRIEYNDYQKQMNYKLEEIY